MLHVPGFTRTFTSICIASIVPVVVLTEAGTLEGLCFCCCCCRCDGEWGLAEEAAICAGLGAAAAGGDCGAVNPLPPPEADEAEGRRVVTRPTLTPSTWPL